jgi:hypothetical protein
LPGQVFRLVRHFSNDSSGAARKLWFCPVITQHIGIHEHVMFPAPGYAFPLELNVLRDACHAAILGSEKIPFHKGIFTDPQKLPDKHVQASQGCAPVQDGQTPTNKVS